MEETILRSGSASKIKKPLKEFSLKAMVTGYRVYFRMAFQISTERASKRALRLFATPLNQKVRSKEKILLNKARREFINFEGFKICIYRWGYSSEPSKKILCIHGWEGNGGNFGGIAEQLVKEGYEVITYDQPAHFRSSGKTSNLLQFSRLTAKLIKQEEPECVIGHSFGSASGVVAFHDNPELQVKKFIMLSSPDKLINVVNDYARLLRLSPENRQHLLAFMEKRFGRKIEEIQMNRFIVSCKAEILLIHDVHDKVIPFSYAENVAKGKKDVQLIPISHAGHYRMLWNSNVIKNVLEFVRN